MKSKRLEIKKHPDLECLFVELEGFEPSSKRGTNLLSTCLSSLKFSIRHKTEATNV